MENNIYSIWPDEMLDSFMEEYKSVRNGLTIYPIELWVEKSRRFMINELKNATRESINPSLDTKPANQD